MGMVLADEMIGFVTSMEKIKAIAAVICLNIRFGRAKLKAQPWRRFAAKVD